MTEYTDFVERISRESDDPRVKIGCVVTDHKGLIRGIGCNRLSPGVSPDMIPEWPHNKHLWLSHAEDEAITEALLTGREIAGGSLYVNALPCSACAKLIVKVNIKRVYIVNEVALKPEWKESTDVSLRLFNLKGISVMR